MKEYKKETKHKTLKCRNKLFTFKKPILFQTYYENGYFFGKIIIDDLVVCDGCWESYTLAVEDTKSDFLYIHEGAFTPVYLNGECLTDVEQLHKQREKILENILSVDEVEPSIL